MDYGVCVFHGRCLVLIALSALAALAVVPAASAAPGQLDPSFGNGGVVKILPSEEGNLASGVAVQADGKVVIAGGEAPGNLLLVRLLENGALDTSFGASGKVLLGVPGGFAEARAVAIQPDGKIVAVGGAQGAVNADFLIARFLPDGSPDPGFGGGDGLELVPVGSEEDEAEAVAIGPDGRIVATGLAKIEAGENEAVGVVVVGANGTPDPSFAGDGSQTIETTPKFDIGVAVAMLGDGRILVADESGAGAGHGFALAQLTANGGPDPSFGGGDGIVETPIPPGTAMTAGGRITDFARRADGRIVAAGYGFDEVGMTNDFKLAVVRYLADGELDPTFAEGGIFTRQLGTGEEQVVAIALGSGEKPVLTASYTPDDAAPAVFRLDANGALDPTFGTGGETLRGPTAPFGENTRDGALDPEDRLVTVGMSFEGNNQTNIVVTRYGDPRPEVLAAANRAPRVRMKKVPKKAAAGKLTGFSGTASDPDGDALSRVQVAVVKLVAGDGAKASRPLPIRPRCRVMTNAKGQFKVVKARKVGGKAVCPPRWLTVKGTAKWRFKLKRNLSPGRYVVYARAVDARGLAGATFSRKLGNRYAFRVLAD